jgi:PIN domain nuclease of toxin-antitoxin system
MIENPQSELVFSTASLWEIAIKRALRKKAFQFDPRILRRTMLDDGYEELPVLGQHAVAVDSLPPIHKDPFDRILIAQAMVEGVTLLTDDAVIAKYPGPIRKV